MPEWYPFKVLQEGDVFKLVDQDVAGVYVVRENGRVESVRHGHDVEFDDPERLVLVTKWGAP